MLNADPVFPWITKLDALKGATRPDLGMCNTEFDSQTSNVDTTPILTFEAKTANAFPAGAFHHIGVDGGQLRAHRFKWPKTLDDKAPPKDQILIQASFFFLLKCCLLIDEKVWSQMILRVVYLAILTSGESTYILHRNEGEPHTLFISEELQRYGTLLAVFGVAYSVLQFDNEGQTFTMALPVRPEGWGVELERIASEMDNDWVGVEIA